MTKNLLLIMSLFFVSTIYAQEDLYKHNKKQEITKNLSYETQNKKMVQNKSFSRTNQFVEIGSLSGSTFYFGPFCGGFGASYFQFLYFQSELNVSNKRIKSISFYEEGVNNWSDKMEIYMGHTDSTRIHTWVEVENMSRVFSGTISTATPSGWLTFELTQPFIYNNEQNLVIAIVDNQTNSFPGYDSYTWETPTDPTAPYAGPKLGCGAEVSGPLTAQFHSWEIANGISWRPDIRFEFEDIPEEPVLLYKPPVADYIYYRDFGALPTGATTSQTIYVENKGTKSITIDSLAFDSHEYSNPETKVVIEPGKSHSFVVNFIAKNIGDLYTNLRIVSKDPFKGDSVIRMRATVYERGKLYEGWEFEPHNFPPLGWDFTGIVTPADWNVFSNWYVNKDNYPESFSYERLGLLQSIGYEDYGVDTLITPLLDIKDGDSLTFYAYDSYTGGEILQVYYTADKVTYKFLKNIVLQGWELISNNPQDKWTKYAVDLSSIPGKYHICIAAPGFVLPHFDVFEGPKLSLPDHDLVITNLDGQSGAIAGLENIYRVEVVNYANTDESNFTIKLMKVGSPDVELASYNASSLKYLDKAIYEIPWSPSDLGNTKIYAKVELPVDSDYSNNISDTLSLTVYSNTSVALKLNDKNPTEKNIYPLNFNWKSNLSQGIYYADELKIGTSKLNEIDFYMDMDGIVSMEHIRVWVGETDLNDLKDGMIPANLLTLVYDEDSLLFPSGEFKFRVPFSQPFEYTGKNLVFMIHKEFTESFASGMSQFYVSTNENHTSRSRSYYDRALEIDPYNPELPSDPGGTEYDSYINYVFNFYADATFYFDVDGLGKINGKVTVSGQPLEDAAITANETYFKASSDINGEYSLPYLTPGLVSLTATKFGYNDVTKSASVIPNFYQVVDFALTEKPQYHLSGKITDHNGNNLPNAKIKIEGYDKYELISDAQGVFSTSIWSENTYTVAISHYGFNDSITEVTINNTDVELGTIVLKEIAAFPNQVQVNITDVSANINWGTPEPALLTDFKYDSGISDGYLGFNSTELSLLGTVFRNKTLITEVSFFIDAIKPTDYLTLYIFGLNEIGKPDLNNVLYKSELIKINRDAWNVYSLPIGVYAENGFYVGFNSIGFLGIGLAKNTGEHPFQYETHYETWSMQHPYDIYYNIPIDVDHGRNNLMIRAKGYNYGKLTYDFNLQKSYLKYLPDADSHLIIKRGEEKKTEDPAYNYNYGSNTRSLTSYIVYRFNESNIAHPANWDTLAVNVQDTSYIDIEWNSLEKGLYYYAVEAVYDSEIPSYIRKSGKVGKDMESEVTINVTIPKRANADNVQITLTPLLKDLPTYSCKDLSAGKVTFHKVWNGDYTLDVRQNNCYLNRNTIKLTNLVEVFDINLQNALPSPINLNANTSGNNEAALIWDVTNKQKIQLDDDSYETGFFALPATNIEFGNYYTTSESKILTNAKVFGTYHVWAKRDSKVYIKVYNNSKQVIGTSEPFELPFNGWVDVKLPNIKVKGNHYIMVSWDYVYMPTNLLAIDVTGDIATSSKPARVKDYYNNLNEFGAAGGNSGAFLIRPYYYNITDKTRNNDAEMINQDTTEVIKLPYLNQSVSGAAKSNIERSNHMQWFNVYLNDTITPLKSGILENLFHYNGLSQESYILGVSVANEFGESFVSVVPYTYETASNDASLKDILIGGSSLKGFNPEIYNYIVALSSDSTTYPFVQGIPANKYAKVTVENNQADYVNIKVVAQDNITQNEYAILFSKNTSVSQNNAFPIAVYPNPSKGFVNFKNATGYRLEIFNQMGQSVMHLEIVNENARIDINSLPVGVFVLKLTNGTDCHVVKLQKTE